jgi:hypothetical protein
MSGTTAGVEFTHDGRDTAMLIFRGKSVRFEVIWGGATPLNITGYTALLQARDHAGRLLIEFSTANGRIQNGGANGTLTFTAPPEATRAIASESGRYELELNTPSGQVYRVLSGAVKVEEEIAQ